MQIRKMIQVVYTKSTVRRWTVWLLCAALMLSMVSPVLPVLATGNEVDEGDAQDDGLIAHFTFDNGSDRLHDDSGHGIEAVLYQVKNEDPALGSEIGIGDWNKYFDGTGDDANALHLDNNACLVIRETDLFNDLTEMTVEMKIKIAGRQTQHWLFYAAQPDTSANDYGGCLGVGIVQKAESEDRQLRILRQKNWDTGLANAEFLDGSGYQYNEWHTVRAVYKISSMALYIDGKRVIEAGAPNKTADYVGKGNQLWFGHSGWDGDVNFNGYIDDIKIYNYAVYDPINEEDYIITHNVDDPDNTTVNMFDYWITEQEMNDYRTSLDQYTFLNSGINKGHLFLFAGSDGSTYNFPNETSVVGAWNVYNEGIYHKQHEPFSGIVSDVLGDDQYPKLAIDQLSKDDVPISIPAALSGRKPNESLAYLFDLNDSDNKAVYPDVTGLFRLDDEGYHYFRSGETYAELNKDQSDSPKTSTTGNHITLYREIWDSNIDNIGKPNQQPLGQFFPFNDWSDLFYQSIDNTNDLVQANNMEVQSTTAEPLSHYLGMSVETEFLQPTNGVFSRGEKEPQAMTFEFSGDDDVWIFIDDVLVGDLGGLHMRVSISIDFSTGKIDYTGDLGGTITPNQVQELEQFDTTLYEVFDQAGRAEDIEWNVVKAENDEDDYKLFPDDSGHTLKFFYLERGNAASNCSIKFNLNQPDPLTEQPSEEDQPADPPAEQSSEENQPEDVVSTAEDGETMTTGILGSPQTGDNSMAGLWIILLAFSIAGIIALAKVYYVRKK